VGDLCYVLGDRWDEFCALTIKGNECLDGGFKMDDGTRFWTHSTAYGDGEYRDNLGRRYGVDAGLIGVVSIDQIDKDPSCIEGGQVIEFKEEFEPYYQSGTFFIGSVTIPTSDCGEEYDWGEDE